MTTRATEEVSGSVARRPAAARGGLAARAFGYDLFISFALGPPPRGTQGLASDLARRLREREHTVFFSEEEAPPGSPLDATLRRALHRSRVLVVLLNHETLRSPRWVRTEVEEFRRRHPARPVIAVNVGGALQDQVLAESAAEWLPWRDHIWLDADAGSAAAGIADPALVDRLATAPRHLRSLVAWRWVVRGSVGLLAALAAGLAVTAWVAIGQRDDALASQLSSQAASLPAHQIDTRLLLGAEALRRRPDRIDARLQLLETLARVADRRALLRPGLDAEAWVRSADGRWLVVVGTLGKLAVVDVARWQIASETPAADPDERAGPARLDLTPDGTLLMFRGQEWTLRPLRDGQLLAATPLVVPRELADADLVRLSPDGRHLLATGRVATWLWTMDGSAGAPRRLSERGALCAAFTADSTQVRLIDTLGSTVAGVAGDAPPATRVAGPHPDAYTPDCTRVAQVEPRAPGVHAVTVRDGMTRALVVELAAVLNTNKPGVSFGADGRHVGIVTSTSLGVWSVPSGTALWEAAAPSPGVLDGPWFSHPPAWLAFEVGDPPMEPRRLQVLDLQTGRLQLDRATEGLRVDDVVFSANGDAAFALGLGDLQSGGRPLEVWRLDRSDRLVLDGAPLRAMSVDLNVAPGLAVTTSDAGVQVWDVAQRVLRRLNPGGRPGPSALPPWLSVTYENDLGGSPFTLHDLLSGSPAPVGRFQPARIDGGMRSLAAGAGGRVHAAGLRDGTVHVLERGQRTPTATPVIKSGGAVALAISPDGRGVVVGGGDGEVALLDRGPPGTVIRLHRHGAGVRQVAFDAAGERVASQSDRGELIVQDARGRAPAERVGSEGSTGALHFVGNGQWLQAGSTVWDLGRRVPVADLAGGDGRAAAVTLGASTDDAAWRHTDGSVRLGRWDAASLRAEACAVAARNLACDEWRRHFAAQPYRKTCDALPAPVCEGSR